MLARNIRYLRKQKGMSQDQLAELLGYKSFTTIQKWESGISEPPFKTLVAMAALFDVDIDDLANKNLEYDSSKKELSEQEMTVLSIFEKLDNNKKSAAIDYLDFLSRKRRSEE